jgi:hypothetical protein
MVIRDLLSSKLLRKPASPEMVEKKIEGVKRFVGKLRNLLYH